MGFYKQHRLNTNNMIDPYESNKWYTIDLKIDWGDNQTVTANSSEYPAK